MQRYKQKQPNVIVEAFQQLYMDATYAVTTEENTKESRHGNIINVFVPSGYWLIKITENGLNSQKVTWEVLSNEKFHSLYEPETVKQKDNIFYPTPEDIKRIKDAFEKQREENDRLRRKQNPWVMPVNKPIDPWVPGTRPGFPHGGFWYYEQFR